MCFINMESIRHYGSLYHYMYIVYCFTGLIKHLKSDGIVNWMHTANYHWTISIVCSKLSNATV